MMKKSILLLSALMTVALVGCGHQHVFSEATCETPATCAEDGVTQGEALGHDYAEATCEAPATCTRCGATEGEALGHDYAEATCEAPATCTRCGATEGEAIDHDFAPATLDAPKTCKVCGATEGEKVTAKIVDTQLKGVAIMDEDRFVKIDRWDFTIYDASGTVVKHFEPTLPNRMTSSLVDNYIVVMGDTSKGVRVLIYDRDGEMVCSGDILKSDYSLVPDFYDDWTYARYAGKNDIEIYNNDSGHIICEIVPDMGEFITTMEGIEVSIHDEETPAIEYDENLENHEYNESINGYLVHIIDKDMWGFIDSDSNEIARYKDVCSFTTAGYTLATDDRETYYVVDTEQNVIAENFISGKSSSLMSNGGLNKYIKITKPDDTVAFVYFE